MRPQTHLKDEKDLGSGRAEQLEAVVRDLKIFSIGTSPLGPAARRRCLPRPC
jgi:hypothetical protein